MIAWTIYVTFGGALLLLFLPHVLARWMALLATLTGLAISLQAFFENNDNATFKTIVHCGISCSIPRLPCCAGVSG